MSGEKLRTALCFALVVVMVPAMLAITARPAYGVIILPNDDTYLDQTTSTTVRDYPGVNQTGGILMKGQST